MTSVAITHAFSSLALQNRATQLLPNLAERAARPSLQETEKDL
jgi:hypothetical protein